MSHLLIERFGSHYMRAAATRNAPLEAGPRLRVQCPTSRAAVGQSAWGDEHSGARQAAPAVSSGQVEYEGTKVSKFPQASLSLRSPRCG